MADVASVMFNLLATNETGPGIAGAKAGMAELSDAAGVTNSQMAGFADLSQAEQAKANASALADWKQTTSEKADAETAAYAEEAKRQKAAAGEQEEASSSGLGGIKTLAETAGVFALGEGIKGAVEAAESANQVYAATNQILQSTGDKAGLTASQVKNLSDSLGENAGVSGIVVQTGLNLALRSQGVQTAMKSGTVTAAGFTQQMLDLAASQNQGQVTSDGVTSAATVLAKALGNPFAATKALHSAGVDLTLQQTAQLAAWKKSGDVADAQALIMSTLSKATSGAADANVTAGQKLAAQFDDLKITIGEKLLPVVEDLETDFSNAINFIGEHSTIFGLLATVLGTVGGAILLIVGAVKVWTIAQEILDAVMAASPIGIVIVLLAGLVAGLVYAYEHFTTFRNGVNDVWNAVKDVFGWIKSNWPLILGILTGPFGLAIEQIITHFHTLKSDVVGFFSDALNWLEHAGEAVIDGLINGVKAEMNICYDAVKGVITGVKDFFATAATWLYDAGKWLVDGFINGIKAEVSGALDVVKGVAGDVESVFKSALGIFSPSRVFAEHGANIMQGLANGITGSADLPLDAITKAATKISGTASGALTVSGGASVSNQHQLAITMDFTGAGTDAMVMALRKAVRTKGKGNVQAYLGGSS